MNSVRVKILAENRRRQLPVAEVISANSNYFRCVVLYSVTVRMKECMFLKRNIASNMYGRRIYVYHYKAKCKKIDLAQKRLYASENNTICYFSFMTRKLDSILTLVS